MILQALYEYYQRKKAELPSEGFELRELKFVIIIDNSGQFVDLIDLRENKRGKEHILPVGVGRAGPNAWQTTFLLWDHFGYILGYPKDNTDAARTMAQKQHAVFLDSIKKLPDELRSDEGIIAVLSFYNTNQIDFVFKHENWKECSKIAGCNLTFRLNGAHELVPQRKAIINYQTKLFGTQHEEGSTDDNESTMGPCLITGEHAAITRLHTATPILNSKSNAKLVAFQRNSGFDSYGKEQSFNAPVSTRAEASYSTALKYLIKSPQNRVNLCDSTLLFWAEKQSEVFDLESSFAWYISESPKDDPDRGTRAIIGLYNAFQTGSLPNGRENRFYVLGLSPNAARISIRLWRTGTIREFGEKIISHFNDFQIVHGPSEPQYLSLYKILTSTALQYKMDNVPPNLAGSVVESILDGSPYPVTLLQQCIRRIRAEQHVTRARAAILKAYINRHNRYHNKSEKEINMALDLTNLNPGYRLGRLFAVLEKIQEEAQPGINATIRDRFYGAASTSPVAVYSQLMKLKNHHLAKLANPGRKVNLEKLIGEIMDGLSNYPAHLSLGDQAFFSIGYYHQRQDFFAKKSDTEIHE